MVEPAAASKDVGLTEEGEVDLGKVGEQQEPEEFAYRHNKQLSLTSDAHTHHQQR